MADGYETLTRGAGYVRLAGRTLLDFRGADRASFLHNLVTNDTRRLQPGQGCETFLTNVQGKILGFADVYCDDESLTLITVPGQAEPLLAHLDKYLIREDVELRDVSAGRVVLLLAGADASARLAEIYAGPLPERPWEHSVGTLGEVAVRLRRTPLVGPNGCLLECSVDDAEAVAASLIAGGFVECDGATVEPLRIEAGTPLFGQDISDANLPQEVDRDATAISFTKGCYLGQETVARIDALGHVNKLLRGVRFAGPEVPDPGTVLRQGDVEVGRVTSAVTSPAMNAPLALAYCRRGHHEIGTRLDSSVGGAEVIALPIEAADAS
ncbi:MAG: folate-binding protein [Planctomycetota bacterium]|nr:MAG: folate-binding protein [Planctomycetota bacterium]